MMYSGSHSTSSLPRRRTGEVGGGRSSKEERRSSTEEGRRSSKEEGRSSTEEGRRSSKEEGRSSTEEGRRSSKEEGRSSTEEGRKSSKEEGRRSSKEEGRRNCKEIQSEVDGKVKVKEAGETVSNSPSSMFSFLHSGISGSDRRRQSMVKGESSESLDRREERRRGEEEDRREERRTRRQSPSPLPKQKQIQETRKSAVQEARRVTRPSSTVPVRSSTLPRNTRMTTQSMTAPILRKPVTSATSTPTTARRRPGEAVIATDHKNKTTIKITKSLPATKKVSFEYSGLGKVEMHEGLSLGDYNNLVTAPTKLKKGAGLLGAGRAGKQHGGSDLSLNRRGRGGEEGRGSTPSLVKRGVGVPGGVAGGQEELAATWLQLKEDIETAMGRKPEQSGGQYKELGVMIARGVESQVRNVGNVGSQECRDYVSQE